ncbi:unnamed protein product [Merluccius merluccius]
MRRWFPGTELDDVKRLLNAGRSSSVSPTRSTHSTTLPVPRKAETRITSESSQTVSTHYESNSRSGTFPAGFKAGHHDMAVQTGHSVQSASQSGSGLKAGPYETGLKSSQYDMSVKSGRYDSLKSGLYDSTVTSDHYDSGIIPGLYGGTAKAGQYDTGAKSCQQYEMTTIRSSAGPDAGARSGYGYDSATLDASALPMFTWSTNALLTSPAAAATATATSPASPASPNMAAATGSSSSYAYQSSSSTNNMGGAAPITGPSSLSVYGFQNNLGPAAGSVLTTSGANASASTGGYGVQKNVSNSGGLLSTGVSATTRGRVEADESYKKDFKYLILDKENVVGNKDTEVLILAKDSGKHFTSSGLHLGGEIRRDDGCGGGGFFCCADSCCSWWKWLLGLLLLTLLLLGLLFGLIALALLKRPPGLSTQ